MDKAEALKLTREYKKAISEKFGEAKVYLYGSYNRGNARKESDIDVAVIVPRLNGDWLSLSSYLWHKVDDVSLLIEPVLMDESNPSPLYEDVIRTGTYVEG